MLKAVIDRFEDDKAILLIGEAEEKVVFPKKFLDVNLKEGDYVKIKICFDFEETAMARKEATQIMQNLIKNSGK